MVMKSFLSDCREAFVISWSYGMGDPLAPSEVEGNREGGPGREARNRRKGFMTILCKIFNTGSYYLYVLIFRMNQKIINCRLLLL
jgi:hypothetical protein